MQNTRKDNVVELGKSGQARSDAGLGGSALLNECGETAAVGLAGALAKTLESAAAELLEMSDRVTGSESRRLYTEAMNFAREQAPGVETEFRRRFYQQFKRDSRRDGGPAARRGGPGGLELSLVEPDELEGSLAASTIENAVNNACGEELFGLTKRVGVLLNDPDLQMGTNPVGPEVIGAAVMETLKGLDLPLKTQLVLVPLINKFLPAQVRPVYQSLNRLLVDGGVLPTIRAGARVPAQSTAPAQPAETPRAKETLAPAVEGHDILATLRQLMTAGTGAGPGAPGSGVPQVAETAAMASLLGDPGASSAAPAVLQSLTQLQHGQSDSFAAAGLDSGLLANGQLNILREIRTSPVTQGMGQMDVMTLDIVAMVFDYILDDRRVPDAMKALIGRLQIPVLKVAMLDRGFFSQKTHPARRLLDVLADASMGWNEEEGHQSGLYLKVDELVQTVLNQFDEKLDIFAVVLEDFLQFQVDEKRRSDEATVRSAQLIRQREQQALARIVAHNEVETHLFDRNMPEFIRGFLLNHWEPLLALHCAQSGEGSEAWQAGVATMDELIWSVLPKAEAEARKKLVAMLPDLLKRLDQGLKTLASPRELRDQFFTGLVKCHAVAVRAGLRGASKPPPMPELPPLPTRAPAPRLEPEALGDFVEIPMLTEVVKVDPGLMAEIAAEPEERPEVEEIVIGDVGWLGQQASPEKDPHERLVQQLKRGSWIEYRQDDGNLARAKLAWVSPMKGIYLFTNRLGQRAMSIDAEGLAAKLRAGEAELIDNVSLMDRAVSSLLEHLQKQVA